MDIWRTECTLAMETLTKSALPIIFGMAYHDDTFLGSLEFALFQLAPGWVESVTTLHE
jgi:hypothetical protein